MSDIVILGIILGIVSVVSAIASIWSNKRRPALGSVWTAQNVTSNLTHATHAFLLVKHAHLIDPTSSRFPLVKSDDDTWTWLLVNREHVLDVYQSITEIDKQLCKVFVLTDVRGKAFIVNIKCLRTLYLLTATSNIDISDLQIPTNDSNPLSYN